jgi:hypothetical protein
MQPNFFYVDNLNGKLDTFNDPRLKINDIIDWPLQFDIAQSFPEAYNPRYPLWRIKRIIDEVCELIRYPVRVVSLAG